MVVIHLYKMIITFHKDYPEKPIVTLPPKNSAPLRAKSIAKLVVKPLRAHTKIKCKKTLRLFSNVILLVALDLNVMPKPLI